MPRNSNINLSKFYENLTNKALYYNHEFYITFNLTNGSSTRPDDETDKFFSDIIDGATIFVKSSKIPKIDMTEVSVNFLSQKFVLPGGVKYDNTWDVTMVIDNDMKVYKSFLKWQELYASLARNGGGTHAIPHCTATVHCLDASMTNETANFILDGVFPTKLPQIQMQYENDSKVNEVAFTLTYQYVYNNIGDEDPLALSNQTQAFTQGTRPTNA